MTLAAWIMQKAEALPPLSADGAKGRLLCIPYLVHKTAIRGCEFALCFEGRLNQAPTTSRQVLPLRLRSHLCRVSR
jgi:hypothetical protein